MKVESPDSDSLDDEDEDQEAGYEAGDRKQKDGAALPAKNVQETAASNRRVKTSTTKRRGEEGQGQFMRWKKRKTAREDEERGRRLWVGSCSALPVLRSESLIL